MKQVHLNIASILSQNVLNGIAHVSDLDFARLVNQLLWSERIFIYGAGKSRLIGEMFAMRLSYLGKQTFFSNQSSVPTINPDDVLLIISESGSSSVSTLYAHQAKNIGASITTLCLPYDLQDKKHLHNIADLCITINPHLNQTEQNQLFKYYPEINMFPLGNGFEISSLFLLESVMASLIQQTL